MACNKRPRLHCLTRRIPPARCWFRGGLSRYAAGCWCLCCRTAWSTSRPSKLPRTPRPRSPRTWTRPPGAAHSWSSPVIRAHLALFVRASLLRRIPTLRAQFCLVSSLNLPRGGVLGCGGRGLLLPVNITAPSSCFGRASCLGCCDQDTVVSAMISWPTSSNAPNCLYNVVHCLDVKTTFTCPQC